MDVENTTYRLENLERILTNISFNDTTKFNLTDDERNISNIIQQNENLNLYLHQISYGTVVISSVGVLTNILVVATISTSWNSWTHSVGRLLLTLACVDIIGNGVCFILYLHYLYPFTENRVLPLALYYMNNAFKRLSYLMMIPISANRYMH